MKIAVATQKGGLEDRVSEIVGRAPSFTIAETSNEEIINSEVLKNEFSEAQSGAGVQAAQMIAEEGAQAIIGGNFGPNLARVFTQSGIKMYQASGIKTEEAIHQLLRGQLTEASGSTGPPGRGKGRGGGSGLGRGRQSGQGRGGGTGPGKGNSRR